MTEQLLNVNGLKVNVEDRGNSPWDRFADERGRDSCIDGA